MERLVDAVKGQMGGGSSTEVEVEGGRGVEEVVEALKDAGVVVARVGKRGSGKTRWNGLDVGVVVKDVKIVGRVEVVGRVDVRCGDTELRGVDLGVNVSVLWADRNLDVRRTSDGREIREGNSGDEMDLATVWWHYGGDNGSCKKWGKMYRAANSSYNELEKLPPVGWRIPTLVEWVELLVSQGMERDHGDFVLNDKEKAIAAWKKLVGGPFKGCLGGYRRFRRPRDWLVDDAVRFLGGGTETSWAVYDATQSGIRCIGGHYEPPTEGSFDTGVALVYYVRCVRDKAQGP